MSQAERERKNAIMRANRRRGRVAYDHYQEQHLGQARELFTHHHDWLVQHSMRALAQNAKSNTLMALIAEAIGALAPVSAAARDIIAERKRQIEKEKYDPAHDDEHVNDEIAALATYYAMPPAVREWPATETGYGSTWGRAIMPLNWVASNSFNRRHELVKAGALIVAEIERLDRAAARQPD